MKHSDTTTSLIGPIGPMSPISPIRLIGLVCLVAACATEEVPQPEEQLRPVVLTAYTPRPVAATRADSLLLAEPTIPGGGSIGVYAYYHDNSTWTPEAKPNFMFNEQATNDDPSGLFTYSPLKYWPNEEHDKLSFMAYYPYVATAATAHGITPLTANTDEGLPTFSFTVDDDVKHQVDFMVSDLLPNLPQSRDTDNDPALPMNDLSVTDRVRFFFRHATAKVEFRITIDDDLRPYLRYFTLKSLNISNIYSSARLTPTVATGEGAALATTLDWSNHERTHTYACKTLEAYLLLPQTLRTDAQLTIGYDLALRSDGTTYTYDNSHNAVGTDTYVYSNRLATVTLNTLAASGSASPLSEWLPGHHYIYIIRIGARRIDFTGTVADWGENIRTSVN